MLSPNTVLMTCSISIRKLFNKRAIKVNVIVRHTKTKTTTSKRTLATYYGDNGNVVLVARHCTQGWYAFTVYKSTLIIRDQVDNIIYGDTIPELIEQIAQIYPHWYKYNSFEWNGHKPSF